MYYVAKPKKIQIYINSSRKTIAQIQKELGCDIIINGGLYNMSTFKPCCWLKADGKILNSEDWHAFGYGWNAYNLVMDTSANVAKYSNYINCVEIIREGKLTSPMYYDTAMGGKRGRTAIGLRDDGNVVVWCTSDGAYSLTPEQLQVEMKNLGCASAIMLDGGGSCQAIMPNGSVTSARIVQNFICIWIAKETTAPPQNTQTQAQPTTPACADGTKAECKYRPPCGYCAKYYKKCPLVEE